MRCLGRWCGQPDGRCAWHVILTPPTHGRLRWLCFPGGGGRTSDRAIARPLLPRPFPGRRAEGAFRASPGSSVCPCVPAHRPKQQNGRRAPEPTIDPGATPCRHLPLRPRGRRVLLPWRRGCTRAAIQSRDCHYTRTAAGTSPSQAVGEPAPTADPHPAPTAHPYPAPTAHPYPAPGADPQPEPTADPHPAPTAHPYPAPGAVPGRRGPSLLRQGYVGHALTLRVVRRVQPRLPRRVGWRHHTSSGAPGPACAFQLLCSSIETSSD